MTSQFVDALEACHRSSMRRTTSPSILMSPPTIFLNREPV
eukprot:CAMPEP_0194768780 /NCGR_PEP_ID=MMETSP0323_2-20130528/40796_1 /TAXON_ID=2866 ORGANISM="Crypthecodinium cohnii, Strain Seligo" /NCGR_SAMPLE_ID=MMETSP0323_2 /ASSEMBLY_ACC=CAM_ASM_000346 /LENGTH=39 /DNA_ID= /DNA_START= /DNA_END= /DNA_ORIENTATION=